MEESLVYLSTLQTLEGLCGDIMMVDSCMK